MREQHRLLDRGHVTGARLGRLERQVGQLVLDGLELDEDLLLRARLFVSVVGGGGVVMLRWRLLASGPEDDLGAARVVVAADGHAQLGLGVTLADDVETGGEEGPVRRSGLVLAERDPPRVCWQLGADQDLENTITILFEDFKRYRVDSLFKEGENIADKEIWIVLVSSVLDC